MKKWLFLPLLISTVLGLTSCDFLNNLNKKDPETEDVVFTNFSIVDEKKNDYQIGEKFVDFIDNGGLSVFRNYSDGTSIKLDYVDEVNHKNNYTVSLNNSQSINNEFSDAGTFVVSVYFDEQPSKSYTIQVKENDNPGPTIDVFPTGLSLNKTSLNLTVGNSEQIIATVLPSNATNKTVSFTSSKDSVASVSNDGVVTALGEGVATITATTVNGKTATCVVNVSERFVNVTNLNLSKSMLSLETNNTYRLVATVEPSNATDKTITWSSSNESVATVIDGLILGIKSGTTTITATTHNNISKTCFVTIEDPIVPVVSVSLNETSKTLTVGDTFQLTATVLPSNASDKSISWRSDNSTVATVIDGLVTAKKAGTANISAISSSGEKEICVVTVKDKIIDVTSIALDVSNRTLNVDDTLKLTASITPSNATNKEITWSSTNQSVATVVDGLVTAKNVGTTRIYAKSNNNKTAFCDITVEPKIVAVSSLVLNYTSATLKIDETLQLVATILPTDATNKNITWSTKNSTIASVSSQGLVTALGVGTATIIATSSNNISASCNIVVNSNVISVTSVSLNVSSKTLTEGDNFKLTETVLPNNATDKTVTWSSSNDEVATVNNGVVNAISEGNATITVSSNNGKTATCAIHVNKKQSSDQSEYTITFKKNNNDGTVVMNKDETFLNEITAGVDYISSVESLNYIYTGIGGIKLGSRNNKGSFSIKFAETISSCNIKSVTVSAAQYGSDTGKVSVSLNETTSLGDFSPSIGSNTYTINSNIKASSLTISTTSKRAYISEIKLVCEPFVEIPVISISMNSTLELNTGSTSTLSVSYTPENANFNKDIVWSTSNSQIATVSSGKVTAIKEGNCVITASLKSDSNIKTTCDVSVKDIKVSDVTLNATSVNLNIGSTKQLSATISPSNATNKNLIWSSSDTSIATVSTSGLVTAKGEGTATITVTTVDGNKTATCAINVSKVAVTGVTISKTSAKLTIGKTEQLTATVSPSNATEKGVVWTSSKPTVATVSTSGLVTAVSLGETTISATTKDGNKVASCTVSVVEQIKDPWTILIYISGNDLESQSGLATSDIKEILSVSNQPENVNIVIQTGGAKSWSNSSYGNRNYLYRAHISNKQFVKDEQLSKANMGLTSTLQSFIEYGLENYPAEKTGLILWNHGGALSGVCYDENYSDDSLTDNEVVEAVSNALDSQNITEKLEFIGYDACLMAVQDIAEFNSPYFNYMICSEESENGEGWDYDTWIDDLYADKPTETILKAIVDGFIADNGGVNASGDYYYDDYYNRVYYPADQTLSYLNLSFASAYKKAWEEMTSALNSKVNSTNRSNFNKNVIAKTKPFSDAYYATFDAYHFLEVLSADTTFNPGSTYINNCKNAYTNLVAYSSAQREAAHDAHGLAMFYPIDSYTKPYAKTAYSNFTNWVNFAYTNGGNVNPTYKY